MGHYQIRTMLLACLAASFMSISCNKDKNEPAEKPGTPPNAPGAIITSTYRVTSGGTFSLSIEPVDRASEYVWTIGLADESKDDVILKSGQGTTIITVGVANKAFKIPANTFSVVAKNQYGSSEPAKLAAEITVVSEYKYKEKTYSYTGESGQVSRTWFTENCRESGEDGNLGLAFEFLANKGLFPGFSDAALTELDQFGGRYYTWYEMMTGIPNCSAQQYAEELSSGKLAGVAARLTGGEEEFDLQIQGCCPAGYHVPNLNDWYDLCLAVEVFSPDGNVAHGGKQGFSIKGSSFAACIPLTKLEFYTGQKTETTAGVTKITSRIPTIVTVGNMGPYFKASTKVSDGGVWTSVKDYYPYPNEDHKHSTFVPQASQVGFNWYPLAFWKLASDGSDKFVSESVGKYGYFWFGFNQQTYRYKETNKDELEKVDDATNAKYAHIICLSGESVNNIEVIHTINKKGNVSFMCNENFRTDRHPVRCVKNY